MNPHYSAFIELGQVLAREKGLEWSFALDETGAACDKVGWNLTVITGDVPPPNFYLRDLGSEPKALAVINAQRVNQREMALVRRPLSIGWQDLIKAAVVDQLLVKRNTPGYAAQLVARPLRVMATCTDKEPWQLTHDDVRRAAQIAQVAQTVGRLGDAVIGIVKVVFDAKHICDAGQLHSSLDVPRMQRWRATKAKHTWSQDELRAHLDERKRSERLPDRRAFWELTRIVMTEKPVTFVDDLKFTAIRAMIVTGLRIGEAALLPVDWKRERIYLDAKGRSAGEAGGISTSLMVRHFAEKQQDEESDSRVLQINAQPVPEMFRELLTETLEHAAKLTEPLRDTLKRQCETGRLLPWYKTSDVVPYVELYTRLMGHAFWLDIDRKPFITRSREGFDPDVLHDLYRYQTELLQSGVRRLDMPAYIFGNRLLREMRKNAISLRFRCANGEVIDPHQRMNWLAMHLHVGDLEQHIRTTVPTKVSDTTPLPLAEGYVQPWEFLFLHPKRSLTEERNEGLCDVTRYMAINRPDPSFIGQSLGDAKHLPSLFEKYGATDEDRALSLQSHALRHLQNTELFRLGVADTIISKRFNRRSVAQSYEYDHRSLAEELDHIDIPHDIEAMLGEKASTVARLIKGGKANGPIVECFLRIQAAEGDAAAYEYLRIEADGFHATPYGHCLNSFTVDPCPKHLECFDNCRHLSATDLPENRANLVRLEGKFKGAIVTIKARPSTSIGWKNQLEHAEKRLAGVQRLLATPPGTHPFPDGIDLSLPRKQGVLDD